MLIISLLLAPISEVIELLIGLVRWPSWQETERRQWPPAEAGEPRHQLQHSQEAGEAEEGVDGGNAGNARYEVVVSS